MTLTNKFLTVSLIYLFFCCFVHSKCPKEYFRLGSMKYCVPWLRCKDVSSLNVKTQIGFGSTKNVYLAVWGKYNVSIMSLKDVRYRYDFYYGLNILKTLGPNNFTLQLIGFCEKHDIIITNYHQYNNALFFENLSEKFSVKESFNFCYSYAKIISFLHNSPMGVLVNCDSNDLLKLLSQLLITNDFELVLGDVDALPEVKENSSIICGHRRISSNLAAPEQLWKQIDQFSVRSMKGYNEKTDIWKVPDVCLFFLKEKYYEFLQYMLFDIHTQCKELDPTKRPRAEDIVKKYNEVIMSL